MPLFERPPLETLAESLPCRAINVQALAKNAKEFARWPAYPRRNAATIIAANKNMQTPPVKTFRPMLWLTLALAVVATSCTTANVSRRVDTSDTGPVKGGTQLMELNRSH